MSASPGSTRVHLAPLDGLRGLAIIMVLSLHFIGDSTPRGTLDRAVVKVASFGSWGVDLFFVLSGFLITGILLDAKSSPRYFRNFYVRRTLRIFPLYYGVLLLLFIVLPLLPVPYPGGLAESASHQRWLWPYGTNFYLAAHHDWALPYVSHFWSLAVEEHFYLFWPVIVLLCSPALLRRVCVAVIAVALGLRCALAFRGAGDVELAVLTPLRLDALCVGGLLAELTRSAGIERVARWARPAFVGAAMLVLLDSAAGTRTHGALRDVLLAARGTFVALTFGAMLVLAVVAARTSLLGRFFGSRVMRFFGKYSYGLYVFHGVVAFALYDWRTEDLLARRLGWHLGAVLVQTAAGVALSLLISVASYELFEKHFLRLKDRFAPSAATAGG
ncbi:MAG TPA: acyltransferase [Polyangiaceae bacterium]|nr:acyltransferase [Polyangiaceae bacterium]